MRPRPISVTIFGILNIFFGVTAPLGLIVARLAAAGNAGATAQVPALKAMYSNPAYITWTNISTPIDLAAALFLLASGIGLLLLKNWARNGSMFYAAFKFIEQAIGGYVVYILIRGLLAQFVKWPESAMTMAAVLAAMLATLVNMVYPALLLFFMTRPGVIASFQPAPAPPSPPA